MFMASVGISSLNNLSSASNLRVINVFGPPVFGGYIFVNGDKYESTNDG